MASRFVGEGFVKVYVPFFFLGGGHVVVTILPFAFSSHFLLLCSFAITIVLLFQFLVFT